MPKFLPVLLKLGDFIRSHVSLFKSISSDVINQVFRDLERTNSMPIIFNGSDMDKNCLFVKSEKAVNFLFDFFQMASFFPHFMLHCTDIMILDDVVSHDFQQEAKILLGCVDIRLVLVRLKFRKEITNFVFTIF